MTQTEPVWLEYLKEFEYTVQTTREQLESRRRDLEFNINSTNNEEMRELCLIGSILDLPDEWDFHPEVNVVLTVHNEQANDLEEVNMARTYSGKNPPRNTYYSLGRDSRVKDTRNQYSQSYSQLKREETLQAKRNIPNLGDALNRQFGFEQRFVETKPVSKEGIMLFCNDPFTAQVEIDAWLAAMDIAIGLNPSWKPSTRLSYMENTLGGIAKLAWNSFKKSISYKTFEDKFNLTKGEGGVFA